MRVRGEVGRVVTGGGRRGGGVSKRAFARKGSETKIKEERNKEKKILNEKYKVVDEEGITK